MDKLKMHSPDLTEANIAKPDCSLPVNSSNVLRKLRVIQSLTSKPSCNCGLELP